MINLSKEYKDITFPLENEDYISYRFRITEHKGEYDLTWQDIKDLCLCFYNEKLSDNWRKFYYFNKEKEEYYLEGCTRILAISDTHVPFQLPISIFEKYRGKVDTLVINGDLIDCYSLSKFTKMYRQPLIDELKKARQYVIDLAEYIKPKKIIAITGNHEIRLGKTVADRIGSELMDLLPSDAMAFIFDTGFNEYNHQSKTKIIYEPLDEILSKQGIEVIYPNNFWYQEGQTIFVHPLAFRSNPLGTSVKAYEYFISMGLQFDTIVMAHTHHVGYAKYNTVHLYEQGACADTEKMSYMDLKLPKLTQQAGYMYIIQDTNGNLVYDKTKLEVL